MDRSVQITIKNQGMMKICTIKDCNRQLVARNLCSPHYQRLMKTGSTDGEITKPAVPCKVAGCINESASFGLCRICYNEYRRRSKGIKPSFNWKGCVCNVCGKSPVRCKGLCNSCYRKHLRANNIELFRKQTYESVQRFNFGGRRNDVLKESGFVCNSCGINDEQSLEKYGRKLDIHHKDGNGRTSEKPNHSLNNLGILCKKCHMSLHRSKKSNSVMCVKENTQQEVNNG